MSSELALKAITALRRATSQRTASTTGGFRVRVAPTAARRTVPRWRRAPRAQRRSTAAAQASVRYLETVRQATSARQVPQRRSHRMIPTPACMAHALPDTTALGCPPMPPRQQPAHQASSPQSSAPPAAQLAPRVLRAATALRLASQSPTETALQATTVPKEQAQRLPAHAPRAPIARRALPSNRLAHLASTSATVARASA